MRALLLLAAFLAPAVGIDLSQHLEKIKSIANSSAVSNLNVGSLNVGNLKKLADEHTAKITAAVQEHSDNIASTVQGHVGNLGNLANASAADFDGIVKGSNSFFDELMHPNNESMVGSMWTKMTEVSDEIAAATTTALKESSDKMMKKAFAFLELSGEVRAMVFEMAKNISLCVVLIVGGYFLPHDWMFIIAFVTLFFGSFLISALVSVLGFLGYLAAWAPQVFMALLVIFYFVRSRFGRAAAKLSGVSSDAAWFQAVKQTVISSYTECKGSVQAKMPIFKLQNVEDAFTRLAEPTVEERLDGIEGMLKKLLDAQNLDAQKLDA